jgi:uncharacterized phage protein (predicted DNA packaging)
MTITVDDLKAQARIDTDAEDALLQVYVDAANASVEAYITDDAPEATVKVAQMQLASMMYRERDGSNEYAVPAQYGYGYLPAAVVALLYPYRKPSLA